MQVPQNQSTSCRTSVPKNDVSSREKYHTLYNSEQQRDPDDCNSSFTHSCNNQMFFRYLCKVSFLSGRFICRRQWPTGTEILSFYIQGKIEANAEVPPNGFILNQTIGSFNNVFYSNQIANDSGKSFSLSHSRDQWNLIQGFLCPSAELWLLCDRKRGELKLTCITICFLLSSLPSFHPFQEFETLQNHSNNKRLVSILPAPSDLSFSMFQSDRSMPLITRRRKRRSQENIFKDRRILNILNGLIRS